MFSYIIQAKEKVQHINLMQVVDISAAKTSLPPPCLLLVFFFLEEPCVVDMVIPDATAWASKYTQSTFDRKTFIKHILPGPDGTHD